MQPLRKPRITAAVLAQAMHHQDGAARARMRPIAHVQDLPIGHRQCGWDFADELAGMVHCASRLVSMRPGEFNVRWHRLHRSTARYGRGPYGWVTARS